LATGTILGGLDGVEVGVLAVNSGSVSNSGTITGASRWGVWLASGGTVGNYAGLIQGGQRGVYIGNSAGSVTNTGTIRGTGFASTGILLNSGGTLTNGVSGSSFG